MQQSALVPAATLPSLPASTPTILDVYAEDSTVTFVSQPDRAPDSDAGLWITRHMFNLAATAHINDIIGLRVLVPVGLAQGAIETAPSLFARPDKPVTGGGGGITLSIPHDGGKHVLHMTFDVMMLQIPTRSLATCIDRCEGLLPQEVKQIKRNVWPLALAVDYVHRLDEGVRVALRMGLRNHPINHEVIHNETGNPEVEAGPAYFIIGSAVELQVADWLAFTPGIQWPVTPSPIRYGPIIAVGLRGSIPSEPNPRSTPVGYAPDAEATAN